MRSRIAAKFGLSSGRGIPPPKLFPIQIPQPGPKIPAIGFPGAIVRTAKTVRVQTHVGLDAPLTIAFRARYSCKHAKVEAHVHPDRVHTESGDLEVPSRTRNPSNWNRRFPVSRIRIKIAPRFEAVSDSRRITGILRIGFHHGHEGRGHGVATYQAGDPGSDNGASPVGHSSA